MSASSEADDRMLRFIEEPMMRWFAYTGLSDPLQPVTAPFVLLAMDIVAKIEPGPERTVALRKLLEAKDAAVRAHSRPGC